MGGFAVDGESADTSDAAILSVKNLLDRFDALAKEPGGKAALETLSQRGITSEERTRLRELVKVAEPAKPVRPQPATDADALPARLDDPRALRA